MIEYRIATTADVSAIQQVAEETWPISYAEIISPEQIRYMLDRMYAYEAIEKSILAENEMFLLALDKERVVGFAGIAFHEPEQHYTRLNKLYVLPSYHGKHIGLGLLNKVIEAAKKKSTTGLHLNVNKYNPAYHFYLKNGFQILEEVVLNIGNGFVMDDYLLVKNW